MKKDKAKLEVGKLVNKFLEFSKDEINSKSETQIRSEFIDPLFEALDWDMSKDAKIEERVLKGQADYILRIGNQNKLVIEAKRTSVRLEEKEGRHKPINIGGGQIFTKVLEKTKLKFGDVLDIEMPVNFPISGGEKSL